MYLHLSLIHIPIQYKQWSEKVDQGADPKETLNTCKEELKITQEKNA